MTVYPLDLNHDGITDFNISNLYYPGQQSSTVLPYASPAAGVEGVSGVYGTRFASALGAGSRIGPNAPFCCGVMAGPGAGRGNGNRWNVSNRYLGLKFQINGKTHYGWARLSVWVTDVVRINAALTGYAYETIPNKPIIAGKTKGHDVITLERAALGRLAQGSTGLAAWRHGK